MRIIKGTLFGGIAYFLIGWLVWGVLLMDLMSARMNQCAARPAGDMVWWAIILSNFAGALLLTLLLHHSKAENVFKGLVTGALFGFLFALTVDLSSLSMTTMFSSIGIMLVDIIASTVVYAIMGMVIVLTWGKGKQGNRETEK